LAIFILRVEAYRAGEERGIAGSNDEEEEAGRHAGKRARNT
jgi:hypothetical protein